MKNEPLILTKSHA